MDISKLPKLTAYVDGPGDKAKRVQKQIIDLVDRAGLTREEAAAVGLNIATAAVAGQMEETPALKSRRGSVINALVADYRAKLQRFLPFG